MSYSCSGVPGFSLKNILIVCIAGLAIYFGWPVVEAIVIFLPLPDPKDVLEKFKRFTSRAPAPSHKKSPNGAAYSGNFGEAPETLGDSDDEKPPKVKKRKGLSYGDSEDEEKDSSELITLDGTRDRTHSAADNVPKLAKPE